MAWRSDYGGRRNRHALVSGLPVEEPDYDALQDDSIGWAIYSHAVHDGRARLSIAF